MPSGETDTPGRRPAHDVLGLGFNPECKIEPAALFILSAEVARIIKHLFQVAVGEQGIVMIAAVFLDIEVNGTVHFISEALIENDFDHLYLFRNMAGSSRLNGRREGVEHPQNLMESERISLNNFHRFHLLQPGLFRKFIVALIAVAFEVTCIRYISYIAYLISEVA